MTSTTTKTAGNGVAAINKHVPAQREHGMDRLREDECYHLTALISDGLNEAEHLVRKAHSKAFSRSLDHDGTKGTTPLDRAEAAQILGQARDCAQVATAYLQQAIDSLQDHNGETPF